MTAWPTAMVTGHRPQKLPRGSRTWVAVELGRLVVRLRDDFGMIEGLSGMALGPDQWWADSLVAESVPFVAHVPFPQQPDRWPAAARTDWQRLVDLAASVVTYGSRYDVDLFGARNRGMVDLSQQTVAVWIHGQTGGTFDALDYAVARGRRPIWVDPLRQITTWPEPPRWLDLLRPLRAARRRGVLRAA